MNSPQGKSNSGIFNMSYNVEEQAVSNYINLLLTKPGERVMQPEYGIGLQYFLFEQNTILLQERISERILTQCSRWLPYIINESITVNGKGFRNISEPYSEIINEEINDRSSYDPSHRLNIIIVFKAFEEGANRTITFSSDPVSGVNYSLG